MKIDSIISGQTVFIDANVFVYALAADAAQGPTCAALLQQIEEQQVFGVTSTHVISELSHRLMTLEACDRFGWPYAGIAARLRRHPLEVQQLIGYRRLVEDILDMGLRIISPSPAILSRSLAMSTLHGLLTNDAIILACMEEAGLTHLASFDLDFDRVPGINRYGGDPKV